MYSNLTLYYLNQMGITPWINKEPRSNLVLQSNESTVYQLVVLTSTPLNDKMRTLFHQMISYVNLQHEDVYIMTVGKQDGVQWGEQLLEKTGRALLSFGPSINDLNLPYPKFHSVPLEYLLDNPSSKKEVFQVLSHLKVCLQTDVNV